MMDNEIQVISDGNGLALFGESSAIETFLNSQGLQSRALGLQRLGPKIGQLSGIAQAGAEISANSGRWLKLTEESARAMDKLPMVVNSSTKNLHATLRAPNGSFAKNLQFVNPKQVGSMLTNPALLAGAGGIMAQLAMEQTMQEITDYLAIIDAKLDEVLQAQKNAVLAELIGVELAIEEAMMIRGVADRVSQVTWSKVQGLSSKISEVQARALLELDQLTQKMEKQSKVADLAKSSKEAETKVLEWLSVLAHSLKLFDGLAVLELDRVLDSEPDELDKHRVGLGNAREARREVISKCTERLLGRMIAAGGIANSKVLLHPTTSRAIANSSKYVAASVIEFHDGLGISSTQEMLEARRWTDAAVEARDQAFVTGSEGVDAALRLGQKGLFQAKTITGKFTSEVSGRTLRRSAKLQDPSDATEASSEPEV